MTHVKIRKIRGAKRRLFTPPRTKYLSPFSLRRTFSRAECRLTKRLKEANTVKKIFKIFLQSFSLPL